MTTNLVSKKVGRHQQYEMRVSRFLETITDYMLDNHCSVSTKKSAKLAGVSLVTAYAWISELKEMGEVDTLDGQIIVRGIVFQDLRCPL